MTLDILDAAFKIDNSGPSALKLLFDKLSAAWQIKDLQSGVDRVHSFSVAFNVKFVDSIRQLRAFW